MHTWLSGFLRIPFVRDVATMQIGRMVTIGCTFLTSILYARFLGIGGYGEYAVILSFTGIFGLLANLGQQMTLTTFLGETYGRRDRRGIVEVSQYYIVTSFGTAVLMGVLVLFCPFLTNFLYGDPAIGMLARLVFLSSMFEFVFSFFAIALQTTREIRLLTFLENAKTVVQISAATLFLILGYGVAGVLWSSVTAAAAFCALSLILYPRFRKRHDFPTLQEMLKLSCTNHLWKYAKDGVWLGIDKSIGNLYPNIFLFILSLGAAPGIVGLLRLAFKLADLPSNFGLNSVSRLASSALSAMAHRSDVLLKNFLRLTRHAVVMHGLISLAGMVLVPFFLPIVYGDEFKVTVYPFLVIISLQILYGVHTCVVPVLRLFSKIYIATAINLVSMGVGIGLFFALKDIITPTRALYIGLAAYHVLVSFVIFPTLQLLKSYPRTNDSRGRTAPISLPFVK